MKLSEVKEILEKSNDLVFSLPQEGFVPKHFHITEVGLITKNYVDCGGTIREEKLINFQLWVAGDLDHRLSSSKLQAIIEKSERLFDLGDYEIEVEYQQNTIGKFGLTHNGTHFVLTNKQTACLAEDSCGIPSEKKKIQLVEMGSKNASCCTPGGSCC